MQEVRKEITPARQQRLVDAVLNQGFVLNHGIARHIFHSRLFWNPLSKQRKLQWWMIEPEGWQYVGEAKRRREFKQRPPEERAMARMGIDPAEPEYGIARRILSNMHLKTFLLKLAPENRRFGYEKLKPLLLFEVQSFEMLFPEESEQ